MKFRAYFHKSTPTSNGDFMLFSGELLTDAIKPRIRREDGSREMRWDKFWSNVTSFCGRVTVMRSTGLRDKNGNEIFEGDVIVSAYQDTEISENKEQGVVEYGQFNCSCCSGVYGWGTKGNADLRDAQPDRNPEFDRMVEVIGNIYENPELLK